jgi:hypothetical protein
MPSDWPELPDDAWRPTKETLRRYLAVIGRVRTALVPPREHGWHAALHPHVDGFATGPMSLGDRDVEIVLDPMAAQVRIASSDGDGSFFPLTDGLSGAAFREAVLGRLDALGAELVIDEGSLRSAAEPQHQSFDLEAVQRYWRVLCATRRVLDRFASDFAGKASPVHLLWRTLDLTHTRHSGRSVAGAGPREVLAFGFRVEPRATFYGSAPVGDDVLAYEELRSCADPDAMLLAFFRGAYVAASAAAGWDVEGLRRTD